MVVSVRVSRAAGVRGSLAVLCWLLAAWAHAQTPAPAPSLPAAQALAQPRPVTGFVPSYEIMRTVRAAGFDPLGPPLREGTTYVLRATDYRGILMHVVLDARTGVIRDVTRIVPAGTGAYGMTPSYGPRAYPPPYGSPTSVPAGSSAEYGSPAPRSEPPGQTVPMQLVRPAPSPPRPVTSALSSRPPLPRPRPAALAAQDTAKQQARPVTNAKTGPGVGANAGAAPAGPVSSEGPPLND